MEFTIVPAYDREQEIGSLFREYTDMLIEGDASFRQYLEMQNYDLELKHLEMKYGRPWGRLYIAYWDGQAAGCIGLRKIDERSCELKRLYVRPQYRGKKLAERLIQRIIADAKEIGYSYILLDTLPFLEAAIHLYRKFGFYTVERYNSSPMNTSIYMRLDLKQS